MNKMEKDLFGGFIRAHILHHAEKEPVFGLWLIGELGRHGYKLGPGTLYPILHAMEKSGYLKSRREKAGARYRRVYAITPSGRRALAAARKRARELTAELLEEEES